MDETTKNVGRFGLVPGIGKKMKIKMEVRIEPPNPSYLEPTPRHANLRLCSNFEGLEEARAPSDGGWSSVLYTATSTCFFFLSSSSSPSLSPSLPLLLPSFFFFSLELQLRAATPPPFSLLFAASSCSFNTRGTHGGELLYLTFFCSHATVATTPPIIRSTRGTCRPCFSLQTGVDGQATRSSNSCDGGGGSWCHRHYYTYRVPTEKGKRRERKRGARERGKKKMKMKNNKSGGRGLAIKLGAFLLCFLNTPKLQGLAPV